jgi:general secretion pathway protein J
MSSGFTLIEILTALLILSILALMSYRALGSVLDTRVYVEAETDKWRRVAVFFTRFERDVQLAAPRPGRDRQGGLASWSGSSETASGGRVEFSRLAAAPNGDIARRVAYALNARGEIELWLWPALDVSSDAVAARYPVLSGVSRFELQYLTSGLKWVASWPTAPYEPPLPRAVQARIVLASGEEIVRVFAL